MRASGGWVSGSQVSVATSSTSPNATRNQKISGQPAPLSRIQPPMIGAIAGAMPKIIDTWLISRCASAPWNRSRITARPTIMPTPADSPCSARNASRVGRSCDSAQPTEPAMNSTSPPRITRLRPQASDSGPCAMLISP
ncbi:hypothetical protein XPR_0495 [Xanthomonas arboricola pv. pruni MAFF 301420]|uniref:Uncharacterized protein n=1 Tax=Xanthomonas arboricola pv. pruni MAFF 301420 TaxID=1418095 RepID=W4SB98_9XANT|nr:hypothetical protein XPR_0495 [Xanthomonas arboricola pv. pruni MAFF 301420]